MKSISVTVSSRGYLVLPAKLRKEMNINAGTKVLLTREEEKIILQPVTSFTEKLSGMTKKSIGNTPEDVVRYIDEERKEK